MTLASSHGKKTLSPWPQFCSCPLKKLVFVPCTVSPMPTFNASPSSVFKAFCKHRTSIPMSNLSKQSSVFFFDNLTSIKINGIHHWWSRAAHRWACDTHPKSALMLKARWDLVSTRPHATIRSTVKIEGSWTTLFCGLRDPKTMCDLLLSSIVKYLSSFRASRNPAQIHWGQGSFCDCLGICRSQ